MNRHLIVIEGTDGSGKSTQAKMTREALQASGLDFKHLTFPRYADDSSMLVRMYLRGDFGTHPEDVNPYAASTFYAADRYASFKTDWQKDWEQGRLIFCDRYTTSNAIHQSSKLPEKQLKPFADWLFDYEYGLLGLPAPTCVIFLDMPPEVSFKMLEDRQGETGDIHELDHDYLIRCHDRALSVCDQYGWHRVNCAENGHPRSMEDINQEILKIVFEELQK